MPAKDDKTPIGVEWEYNTLREEILRRIEMRQQIVSITLTIAGAFLAVGLNTKFVALVYPPLAMFLAFGWAQNDFRIRRAAEYIRNNIEKERPSLGLGYETSMQDKRKKSDKKAANNEEKDLVPFRFVVFSHGGAFTLTQIMATSIGAAELNLDPHLVGYYLLLAVDIISIVAVIWVFYRAQLNDARSDEQKTAIPDETQA